MRRKFKCYAIRLHETVGIGIEEHSEHHTLSVASIFVPYRPTNKGLFDIIARHVVDQLEDEEVALLRVTLPMNAKYQWAIRYNGRLIVEHEPYAHFPFIQVQALAEDALRRKTTIIKGLPEGVTYRHLKGGENL